MVQTAFLIKYLLTNLLRYLIILFFGKLTVENVNCEQLLKQLIYCVIV